MSDEIKIHYDEVEECLIKVNSSSGHLDAKTASIEGSNQLNIVKKINQINKELKALAISYQSLLKTNIEETQTSLEKMKEADEVIAASVRRGHTL